MTDAHCHVSGGDESVKELLVGRDFFGVHPWEVSAFAENAADKANDLAAWLREELAAHPSAGVGEIGLDRLRQREIPPLMREVFEKQLEIAFELGRPVILHGAKCWGQVVKTIKTVKSKLRDEAGKTGKAVGPLLFHGFSRSGGLIPDIVALNGYISAGPAVLNDHAVNYRALVKKIPADRLLVETDRDCQVEELVNPLTGRPLVIRDILAKTAEIRGVSADELERVTDENAAAFVNLATMPNSLRKYFLES